MAITRFLLYVLLLVSVCPTCIGQDFEDQDVAKPKNSAADRAQVSDYENKKLKIEQERVDLERENGRRTLWSVLLPAILGMGTVVYGVWSFRQTTRSQYKLKLIELALAASNPFDAKGRARLVAALIGHDLPKDLDAELAKLKPEDFGRRGLPDRVFEARVTLVKSLAENPERRQQILNDWKSCFPDDECLRQLGCNDKIDDGAEPATRHDVTTSPPG